MSPKPFQGYSESQDPLQPYTRGCLYSFKSFDKTTPDSAHLVTQTASIWPTPGSANTGKQCFLSPTENYTKNTEFLTTGFAQLPQTKVSDQFLNTFHKYSQSKKLKASSKPDSCIPPPIALVLYGREKNPKKSTRKPNKKAKLGACKE